MDSVEEDVDFMKDKVILRETSIPSHFEIASGALVETANKCNWNTCARLAHKSTSYLYGGQRAK